MAGRLATGLLALGLVAAYVSGESVNTAPYVISMDDASVAAADTAASQVEYPPRPNLPFAGYGTCDEPQQHGEFTTVRCLGPEEQLKPGQTKNVMALLASPYPLNGSVVVINQTAQIINETGNPVPLSEVYVHHYVSSTTFLLGSGAELRGQMTRQPLEWPLALVVDTQSVSGTKARLTNILLISTAGIAPEDLAQCLECPCKDISNRGGFACCRDESCHSKTPGPPRTYRFEYNVTFRPLTSHDHGVQPVDFIGYDVTGGEIEYQILQPMGLNTTHMKVLEMEVDAGCPQQSDFEIVRCTGHQHIGARCITLYNAETKDTICRSCPVLGTQEGQPGNEAGYVVKMTDDNVSPPYKILPGTRVRLESMYDGNTRRLGVMGLMSTWVANLSVPCHRQFGYAMASDVLANFDASGLGAAPFAMESTI
ncbi:hypothetical protein WJX81_007607 [Elliptochloris bilobata]|uniref:Uncharacterized protein n=1 Tax=Elliptochloris bilobata TaxID=381761 RepID=A0AAW1S7M4_9CHLO